MKTAVCSRSVAKFGEERQNGLRNLIFADVACALKRKLLQLSAVDIFLLYFIIKIVRSVRFFLRCAAIKRRVCRLRSTHSGALFSGS